MTGHADPERARRERLWHAAAPLTGDANDLDPLLSRIGGAQVVLLGEASHGTHEFYSIRAQITRRLIVEKGFSAVAVEADWPDAYRVNRYVRSRGADTDAVASLSGFQRFPRWMWRNAEVLDFVGWLRAHNESPARTGPAAGFYGLDLYSLHASVHSVLEYLDTVDPEAAARARWRYACFDRFNGDLQAYGHATSLGLSPGCESEAVAQLLDLRHAAMNTASDVTADAQFAAEQNARLVTNAEQYYRAMFGRRVSSWNLRDEHMADTLDELIGFLARSEPEPRVVVWAHNSHIGDARATQQSRSGELNLGQLVRERHPSALLVGFSTYRGTVTAASDWDEPAERKVVRDALPESYEALLHGVGIPNFMFMTADAAEAIAGPRLQRAIGVIYRPETERQSHYYHVRLPLAFDVMIHCDTTRALEPIDRTPLWQRGDVPETYPSAL